MTAYYNEIDPKAAAWLRELIAAGHIAPGDVDERSIEDVTPNELNGYTQCHFFAGIGVWSYALRQAGWSDDRPVWTGSCPCQPFSAAGKGKGTADERHLWPAFFWLIDQCRPVQIFGEQVAGKAGWGWFDIVSADLEGVHYTCGATDFPACGLGSPHKRQRLYWVADAAHNEQQHTTEQEGRSDTAGGGRAGRMADADGQRREQEQNIRSARVQREGLQPAAERHEPGRLCTTPGRMADAGGQRCDRERILLQPGRQEQTGAETTGSGEADRPGPTAGFWGNADWLYCRDEKWRAVESGSSPLADGPPARVGRLRGYGNAIVAPQAQAWIEVFMEGTA